MINVLKHYYNIKQHLFYVTQIYSHHTLRICIQNYFMYFYYKNTTHTPKVERKWLKANCKHNLVFVQSILHLKKCIYFFVHCNIKKMLIKKKDSRCIFGAYFFGLITQLWVYMTLGLPCFLEYPSVLFGFVNHTCLHEALNMK